jgi:hypothetical protein
MGNKPSRLAPLIGKTVWILAFAYFCLNGFIVIVPLIGTLTDGECNRLDLQGWYYVTIVAGIFLMSIIYYFSAFASAAVRSDGDYEELLAKAEAMPVIRPSIMSLAGVHPEIIEQDVHDAQYGNRRTVAVIIDDDVRARTFLLQTRLMTVLTWF